MPTAKRWNAALCVGSSACLRKKRQFLPQGKKKKSASGSNGLRLSCFGGFHLQYEGRPLELKQKKARELLALLACERGRPVSKRRAAALLWDSDAEQGRSSLSKVCRFLTRFSEEHGGCLPLTVSYGALSLEASEISVDLEEFLQLAAGESIEDWRAAAALYTGELLFAESYEWIEDYAGKYEIEYLELCRRLAEHYRKEGLQKLAEVYEREIY